jgi:hypothetical protein
MGQGDDQQGNQTELGSEAVRGKHSFTNGL